MANKPSTDEILKMLRQKDGAGSASPPKSDVVPEAAKPATPAATESPAAVPASAPKSTADILAAARKQTAPATDAPAAKPKSTADILAALRAEKAGPKAAETATTASATSQPATAAAVPSAAPQLSVKDMLEQLKPGSKPSITPAATDKLPLRVPVKPDKPLTPVNQRRRSLVLMGLNALLACVSTPFAAAWTMMAAMAGTWTLAIARFMFPNVLVEPPTRFKIGPASDYPPGAVSTKWTAARGIWVVHTDQYKGAASIYALASVCTHLGCTPNWLDGEQKFKCPCHGSGFYITGINFEGPAPRPLERVGLRLAPDGTLEVDKSVKFQEEKGQWEDSKSFVDASLV